MATEDLVEKLHAFLETEEANMDVMVGQEPQPPPRPKKIAKHRIRRSLKEYLVYDEDKELATGTWMKHQEVPSTALINYLMSQQNYPSTRGKVQTLPTINLLSLSTTWKEATVPLFKILVALSITMGVCACYNFTGPEVGNIVDSQKEPDIGTLYN